MARGNGRGKGAAQVFRVRLLGPLAVLQGSKSLPLPASRKVRALLAYLAMAPRPVGRSQLCELLWDAPTDPRGELRWCLSKIRSVIGQRVVTADDALSLDLSGCSVDALDAEQAAKAGVEKLEPARQRDLAGMFEGDFLEGLELARAPVFGSWLTAHRRRFRAVQAALLERLAAAPDDKEAFAYLDKWLELAPFDRRVHQVLLMRLAARGRLREGEEHLARAAAMFEEEGLDVTPLRAAWTEARTELLPLPPEIPPETSSRRASIAVMPFNDQSPGAHVRGGAADALAHDITTRLAKLRSMFVIAQGSTFALADRLIGPEEAGRMLNVDYVLSGSVHQQGARLTVAVELVETRTAHSVWYEIMEHPLDDAFLVLEEIGNRIVASIASEIETIERNRAILRPPNSLDAWESHHRGLWHMYRFTPEDNEKAKHFFQVSVKQDRTFSRAYAGLSFVHFQDAYLGLADRKKATDKAFDAAAQGLEADERDPAAHLAMGRSLWLRGRIDDSIVALRRSLDLAPNFAFGHYALSFVQSQSGDPNLAIASADTARALSPYDPMLFGMMGTRALSLARLGRYDEAAEWGVKAATRPNARAIIYAIAVVTLALAGRLDEARKYLAAVRRERPDFKLGDFLAVSHYTPDAKSLFHKAGLLVGLT
jgi:DNA-binding SARP family transcriptional activator/TolB-like protein